MLPQVHTRLVLVQGSYCQRSYSHQVSRVLNTSSVDNRHSPAYQSNTSKSTNCRGYFTKGVNPIILAPYIYKISLAIPYYDKSSAKANSPFNNRTTAGPPIYIHKFLTFRKENTADQTCGNLEKNKRQQRGGWQGKVGGRRVHGAIEVSGGGGGTRAWPTARPTTGQIQRQLAHLVQSNHVCTATKLSTTNTWVPAGYCSSSPCKFQNKELSRLCTLQLLADQNSKISYNFKLVLQISYQLIISAFSSSGA